MKKLLVIFTCLTAFTTQAKIASVEVGGNFVNEQGCKVRIFSCANFNDKEAGKYNGCSLELYENGDDSQFVPQLTSNGKITSATSKKIIAQDKGVRTNPYFPYIEYVNVKAEITVKKSFKDETTYPDLTVAEFDIVVTDGGRVFSCKNMVLDNE